MKRPYSKVRAIRESRGLRQIDLVILTGLSLGTIGHFDKGNRVSLTSVQKIARALGVQPGDLTDQPDQPAK